MKATPDLDTLIFNSIFLPIPQSLLGTFSTANNLILRNNTTWKTDEKFPESISREKLDKIGNL